MNCIHVTTQTELDTALTSTDPDRCIHLDGDGEFFLSSYGSASVSAYGSASVSAYGSASVSAYGSASVSAYDSASVSAYDSASVSATKYVAIHKHTPHTTITGGVVIEPTDMTDPTSTEWADYYGLDVTDGIVTVFKGVNDQWTTSYGADYSPGATPAAADWAPTNECGNGLHFSPSPGHTFGYNSDATKFLACPVKLAELVVLGDKVKAPRVEAPGCVEVDLVGRPVKRAKAATKK